MVLELTADRDGDVFVVGRRSSPHVQDLRDFLTRNRVTFGWVDIDHHPLVPALGAHVPEGLRLPVFVYADGSVSEWPAGDDEAAYTLARAQLAERVGLHTRPDKDLYDVVIVGAGPAGLTAAVYAASEGLDTVVIELHVPGGQAGTSSRIENYPGFPDGISGEDLANAAFEQARRFGAEFVIGCDFNTTTADEHGMRASRSSTARSCAPTPGSAQPARTTGTSTRPAYASCSAPVCTTARRHAKPPTTATAGCSSSAVRTRPVRPRSTWPTSRPTSRSSSAPSRSPTACRSTSCRAARTTRASRFSRTRRWCARSAKTSSSACTSTSTAQVEKVDADALFILIGGVPTSARVDWVRRDEAGFFLTGPDVVANGGRGTWWKLEREPLFLESSTPGIFFAGDVRHGSIKRVASAVGEGAMAVQQVHRFLAEPD